MTMMIFYFCIDERASIHSSKNRFPGGFYSKLRFYQSHFPTLINYHQTIRSPWHWMLFNIRKQMIVDKLFQKEVLITRSTMNMSSGDRWTWEVHQRTLLFTFFFHNIFFNFFNSFFSLLHTELSRRKLRNLSIHVTLQVQYNS